MIRIWYPPARTKEHYVFLNTLSEDNPSLYSAAKSMLSLNPNLEEDPQLVFKEGIDFLRKAAESERQKELAFLEKKGYSRPANGDYKTLIKNINDATIKLEEFRNRVKEEKDRYKDKGTGGWSYTQGLSSYISSARNQMTKAEGRKMTTVAGVVRSALIKQFKSLSGSLDLNQLSSVIGMSQSFLMGEITRQVKDEDDNILSQFLNKDGKTINQKKIENLIENTDVYKMYIKEPEKNLKVLTEYANNILSKYGNGLSKEAKDALKKAVGVDKNGRVNLERKLDKEGKDIGIDWQKVVKNVQSNGEYAKLLEDIAPEKRFTINITGNTGVGGEARIYNDIRKSLIEGRWVGKAGGKIDLFTVEIESNINNGVVADTLSDLISQETQSHFLKTSKAFSDYYAEIDRNLVENENPQNNFIIHYNVKDYVSTNSSKFSGFEGGEYHGLQFIEAIAALQEAGFASADIDFLTTCFVNTAEEAVGGANKEGLEKYFSLFATMMLFDDGRVIAEQAANNLSLNSLKVLHIFPLNGIYVPSSVIMTMVANELEKSATMEAAKVSISPGKVNFAEELQKLNETKYTDDKGRERTGIYNYKRWESIRNTQIAAMSARIRFLANFSTLIGMFDKQN